MKAVLALEDGFTLEGTSFTGEGESSGELIFYKAMAGFTEIMTQPALYGTMLAFSYTEIGNAGVCYEDMLSTRAGISALIVKRACKTPSNWRSEISLPDFLKEQKVLGVEDLDTRALSVHLRDHGPLKGVLSTDCEDIQALIEKAKQLPDAYPPVAPTSWGWRDGKAEAVDAMQPQSFWNNKKTPVAVLDVGIDRATLRKLEAAGCDLLMLPPDFSMSELKAMNPALLILSDGRTDYNAYTKLCANILEFAETKPVLALGLGQIFIAKCLGAKVARLAQGNYGLNHSIKDIKNNKIIISNLCQSYGIDISALKDITTTHVHLNDDSIQGFKHDKLKLWAWQFAPNAKMIAELMAEIK